MIPSWLANLQWLLYSVPPVSVQDRFYWLIALAPEVDKHIEAHHIRQDAAAYKILRRWYRIASRFADFSQLRHWQGLGKLPQVYHRAKRLLEVS